MKKLLILYLSFSFFSSQSQTLNKDRTGFTETFEFENISDKEIISKTKEWLVLKYSTEEFKLILDEDDKLICWGYFHITDTNHYVKLFTAKPGMRMNTFTFSHKIIIDVKDSRMRIRFVEFEYITPNLFDVIYTPYYLCESSSDSLGMYLSEIQTRNKLTPIYKKSNIELEISQSLKTRVGLSDSIKQFCKQLQNDLVQSIKDVDEWYQCT